MTPFKVLFWDGEDLINGICESSHIVNGIIFYSINGNRYTRFLETIPVENFMVEKYKLIS